MKRELSDQAKVAKLIRQELKKHGIKGRVRSASFSMGDSVHVYVTDLMPATIEKIKEFCAKFEYGHFDVMTDMYEYSNRRHDIPQTKFLVVNVEYSDEMQQSAWDYFRTWHAGYDDKPENYTEAQRYDYDIAQQVYRVLNGSQGHFWAQYKPKTRIMANAS